MQSFNTASAPSWADLKDSVVPLKDGSDFERWNLSVREYAFGKGVLHHLDSDIVEPGRHWSLDTPLPGIAGSAPPSGRSIKHDLLLKILEPQIIQELKSKDKLDSPTDPTEDQIKAEFKAILQSNRRLSAELDTSTRKSWDLWARSERFARIILISTIPLDLKLDYMTTYSAHDVYKALIQRFRSKRPEQVNLLKRELHSLYLPADSNADKTESFLNKVTTLFGRFALIDSPLSDSEKIAAVFGSLSLHHSTLLRSEWSNEINRTWSNFTNHYATMVSLLHVDEKRSTSTGSVNAVSTTPTSTQGSKKNSRSGQSNNKSTQSGNNSTSTKTCKHHPTATSHMTADCYVTRAISEYKKNHPNEFTRRPNNSTQKGSTNSVSSSAPPSTQSPSTDTSGSTAATYHSDFDGFANNMSHVLTRPKLILIDTGATHHIFGTRSLLSELRPSVPSINIGLAGTKHSMTLSEVGALSVGDISIQNVYHCPDTADNLLSTRRLIEDGWSVDFNSGRLSKGPVSLRITNSYAGSRPSVDLDSVVSGSAAPINMDLPPQVQPVPVPPTEQSTLHKLHIRFGHIGRPALMKVIEAGLVEGVTRDDVRDDDFKMDKCGSCMTHKTTRLPRPGPSPRGLDPKHEYVHSDLKEFSRPTQSGLRYWVVFVSDIVSYRTAVAIRTKDQAWQVLKTLILQLERQADVRVKVVRTDNGTEFKTFAQWCNSQGIIHQTSPPYEQALNGVAERFNRTLAEAVRTLLHAARLSHDFWPHAMNYACMILNMTTINSDGRTAYEAFTGRKPNLGRILPFGHRVYARLLAPATHLPGTEQPRSVPARILSMSFAYAGWVVATDDGRTYHVRSVFERHDNDEGPEIPTYEDEDYAPASSGPEELLADADPDLMAMPVS